MSSRIPAGQIEQFESWSLPTVEQLDENGERVLYGSLTAEALEEITNQAIAEGREQGYKEGFAEGERAGHQEALKLAQPEIRQRIDRLIQVAQQLMEPIDEQIASLEQSMVGLVGDIARAVVKRDLQIAPAAIEQVVAEAVAALPRGADQLTLHLHPSDIELISSEQPLPENWQVKPDIGLSVGGCRVTTRNSVVDHRVEHRLEEILASLHDQQQVATDSAHTPSMPDQASGDTNGASDEC